MVASRLVLAAAAVGLVTSLPEPAPAAQLNQRNNFDCSGWDGCLGILKNIGPEATSFCRSYLGQGQARATKTKTTIITPAPV